jgi:ABC-2 type transport system permease protein
MYFLSCFWTGLYVNARSRAGLSLQMMITYALLSRLAGVVLENRTDLEIAQRVRTGEIAIDLMRPVNYFGACLAQAVGRNLSGVPFRVVPPFVLGMVLFHMSLPNGLFAGLCFVISLILAYMVMISINFLVGVLAFWTTDIEYFNFIKVLAVSILSGSFVPLWFFPPGVASIMERLPFACIYHVPLSIYVGRLNSSDSVAPLALQLFWAIGLLVASQGMLRVAVRKVVIQGG